MPETVSHVTMNEVRVLSSRLPDGWSLRLQSWNDKGYMGLYDPRLNEVAFPRSRTIRGTLRAAVDHARDREGLPPIDWSEESP